MRSIISFTVTGHTRDELTFKALETYRALVGDKEAELPSSATIEIQPESSVASGDGTVQVTYWEGHVSATLNDDGPTR